MSYPLMMIAGLFIGIAVGCALLLTIYRQKAPQKPEKDTAGHDDFRKAA